MKPEMMKECCDTDGKPNFDKMCSFMKQHDRGSKLDASAWAVFFIWIGAVWLADLGFGIGLLGIGIITLGAQLFRAFKNIKVERFWIVVGSLFALGGLWELLAVEAPLFPVLLIVAGIAVLVGTLRSTGSDSESGSER